ncbi:MAG: DUF3180 domain-containing protein [Actinomycetota bacterium]|nr:DUF3180 domain-containing protein [Actinomycetota bacterium]MDQ3735774.1 DUF3180 domain-containing protein [Actinomycetota bacterium]
MTATKARDLAAIGVAVAVVTFLLVRQFYGSLPPLQWYLSVSLGVLGIAELMIARVLHERIRGEAGLPPVEALMAARAAALAKASAVAGSGFVGLWLGVLAYTLPNMDFLAAAGSDTVTGVIGVLSSALLVTGALVLENACRTPPPPRDRNQR